MSKEETVKEDIFDTETTTADKSTDFDLNILNPVFLFFVPKHNKTRLITAVKNVGATKCKI